MAGGGGRLGRNHVRVVDMFWGRPRVGLCAAGQPWAGGRNPFGIGGVTGLLVRRQGWDGLATVVCAEACTETRPGRPCYGGLCGGLYGDKGGTALLRWFVRRLVRRQGRDGLATVACAEATIVWRGRGRSRRSCRTGCGLWRRGRCLWWRGRRSGRRRRCGVRC